MIIMNVEFCYKCSCPLPKRPEQFLQLGFDEDEFRPRTSLNIRKEKLTRFSDFVSDNDNEEGNMILCDICHNDENINVDDTKSLSTDFMLISKGKNTCKVKNAGQKNQTEGLNIHQQQEKDQLVEIKKQQEEKREENTETNLKEAMSQERTKDVLNDKSLSSENNENRLLEAEARLSVFDQYYFLLDDPPPLNPVNGVVEKKNQSNESLACPSYSKRRKHLNLQSYRPLGNKTEIEGINNQLSVFDEYFFILPPDEPLEGE